MYLHFHSVFYQLYLTQGFEVVGVEGFFCDHMCGFMYTSVVTWHNELKVRERTCMLPLLICCTVLVVMEHLMKLPNRAALELPEEILFSVMSFPFLPVIFHKLCLLKWHKKSVLIHLDTQAWGRHVWTCWSSCCSRRVMETKDQRRQLDLIDIFMNWLSLVCNWLPYLHLLCSFWIVAPVFAQTHLSCVSVFISVRLFLKLNICSLHSEVLSVNTN